MKFGIIDVGGGLRGEGLGFCGEGKKGVFAQALQEQFTPEFLGRLDATVYFEPLGENAMEAIAQKYLRQLQQRSAAAGIQLLLPGELAHMLSTRCMGRDGARQLRRLVQTEVEDGLATFLLRCPKKPGRIHLRLEEGKLRFGA